MPSSACCRRTVLASGLSLGLLAACRADRDATAGNSRELSRALEHARPGDEIVLADGTYDGGFTLTASGTAEQPIVIRAARILGAVIAEGAFEIDADNVILHGLDFAASVLLIGRRRRAARFRLRRCRFRDRPAAQPTIAVRLYNAPDFDGAYNEWRSWAGRGFAFALDQGAARPVMRHGLFRDTPPGFKSGDGEALHWSFGPPDAAAMGLIERCKFKNWNGDGEIVSIKASRNTVRQCVFENCEGEVSNRFGGNNSYEACWFRNSWGVRIHDGCDLHGEARHNRVLGCRLENVSRGIQIYGGDQPPCARPEGNFHNAAGECLVSGCEGLLVVGRVFSQHASPARGTRIRQHVGPIELREHQITTRSEPDRPELRHSWPSPVWLDDDEVGPFADLAAEAI